MPSFSIAFSSSISTSTPSFVSACGAVGELLGKEDVRRLVDEVARDDDALGESLARLSAFLAGAGSATQRRSGVVGRSLPLASASSWSCTGRSCRPQPHAERHLGGVLGRDSAPGQSSDDRRALRPSTLPAMTPPSLSEIELRPSFSPPRPDHDQPLDRAGPSGASSVRADCALPLKRSAAAAAIRSAPSAQPPRRAGAGFRFVADEDDEIAAFGVAEGLDVDREAGRHEILVALRAAMQARLGAGAQTVPVERKQCRAARYGPLP